MCSSDLYFMDKVVDHLLVFQGDGRVKDFPGNYTQYREWERLRPMEESAKPSRTAKEAKDSKDSRGSRAADSAKRRLTFNEKREFQQLTADLEALEREKSAIVEALSGGEISVEEITEKSKRLPLLQAELDEKEMRWLELSELA